MKGTVKAIRPLLSPRIMCLTGTPVSESPSNAWGLLSVLAPERMQDISRARYDKHFVVRSPVKSGPVTRNKAVAYSNLEELKRMLEHCSVRRLKADVRGMPEKTEDLRHCEVTVDQAEHYAEIMKGILAEIAGDPDWAKTLDIAMVKILRARQVLNHPSILGLAGDSGKYQELDGIVEEVLSNPDAKLVLWSEWNAAVDLLAKRYEEYGVLTIDQRTSQADLANMDKTFDYDDNRIVVGTPAKAGTGIDFLSRARTSIYLEKTYSLVNYKQSIDRIVRRVTNDDPADSPVARRIKSIKRSPATILFLHVPGSVDDIVSWVLQKKLDLGDALLQSDDRLIADGRTDLIDMLRARAVL